MLNPTFGMHHHPNRAMMRTRSYENGVFICFAHPKQALVTAPDGSVDGGLVSDVPDLLIHDIDLSRCDSSHLDDRRPDIHEGLQRTHLKPTRRPTRIVGEEWPGGRAPTRPSPA